MNHRPAARRLPRLLLACMLAVGCVGAGSLVAQEPVASPSAAAAPAAAPSPAPAAAATAGVALSIVKLAITPDRPGPDTLCQLRVTLKNGGDKIASQLGFDVTVNGVALPVYKNQLFMQRVDPGQTVELRLYNFWSTETSRPAPADGKYKVEVTLREAQWYAIGDEAGTEVWNPLAAVTGLPVRASLTVGK